MRLILILILLGITLIACGSEERKANNIAILAAEADSIAKPRFATMHFTINDKLYQAKIDQRYKDFEHKTEFSLSVFITINTVNQDEKGHPTPDENKVFTQLESDILRSLNKTSLNAYIGNTTMDGYRDMILYINPKDQKVVNDVLLSLQKQHPRIKEFIFEEDPEWEAVAEFYQASNHSN